MTPYLIKGYTVPGGIFCVFIGRLCKNCCKFTVKSINNSPLNVFYSKTVLKNDIFKLIRENSFGSCDNRNWSCDVNLAYVI